MSLRISRARAKTHSSFSTLQNLTSPLITPRAIISPPPRPFEIHLSRGTSGRHVNAAARLREKMIIEPPGLAIEKEPRPAGIKASASPYIHVTGAAIVRQCWAAAQDPREPRNWSSASWDEKERANDPRAAGFLCGTHIFRASCAQASKQASKSAPILYVHKACRAVCRCVDFFFLFFSYIGSRRIWGTNLWDCCAAHAGVAGAS